MAHERSQLFGTDGARGEAGTAEMNAQMVGRLTTALIDQLHEQGDDGRLVIGADTRPSSPELSQAAIAAAEAADVEVINLGVAPTPTAQRIAKAMHAMGTVVITASHNPWQDNGFKAMNVDRKLNGDEIRAVSDRYWHQVDKGLFVPTTPQFEYEERSDLVDSYRRDVVGDITRTFGAKPLRETLFVIDGANGAGQNLMPAVFRQLGASVIEYRPGGLINENCGAADLSGLKDFLRQRPEITRDPRFVGALANDGDADRVMGVGVGEDGELVEISGNHIMYALATHGRQPGIVGTEYTNSGMVTALHRRHIDFDYCDNGDINVTNALLAKQQAGEDWRFGGEFSGHLVKTDWLVSGDGIHSAAWFAAWATNVRRRTFGELYAELPLWAEEMSKIKSSGNRKFDAAGSAAIQAAMARVVDEGGRSVIRSSGTEKGVVRVWNENEDPTSAEATHHQLVRIVQAELEAA